MRERWRVAVCRASFSEGRPSGAPVETIDLCTSRLRSARAHVRDQQSSQSIDNVHLSIAVTAFLYHQLLSHLHPAFEWIQLCLFTSSRLTLFNPPKVLPHGTRFIAPYHLEPRLLLTASFNSTVVIVYCRVRVGADCHGCYTRYTRPIAVEEPHVLSSSTPLQQDVACMLKPNILPADLYTAYNLWPVFLDYWAAVMLSCAH